MAKLIRKEDARLGMRVLFGTYKEPAAIDGICWDWVGIKLDRGGYVIADWENVYRKEED